MVHGPSEQVGCCLPLFQRSQLESDSARNQFCCLRKAGWKQTGEFGYLFPGPGTGPSSFRDSLMTQFSCKMRVVVFTYLTRWNDDYWSLFLQSDVQSVITCSACMRPPGQAVFGLLSAVWAWTPEEGAAFNPSWTREGGAWIFPSSVPRKGGWLYFTWRLSVDVGVLKSPCYPFPRFWAGPVHGDEDPCMVMKTWWTSAGSCRWQIALQVAREYHTCPSVRAMPPMKTNFNLIVTIFFKYNETLYKKIAMTTI